MCYDQEEEASASAPKETSPQKAKVLSKIKQELSSHIVFSKPEVVEVQKKPVAKHEPKAKKMKTVVVTSGGAKKPDKCTVQITVQSPVKTMGVISKERMTRFFKMRPQDLPQPSRKTYACERDIRSFKTPTDTLRCTSCGNLYERIKKNEHMKSCTKNISDQHRYACAVCNFKHIDLAEIERHVQETHRNQPMNNK